MEHLPKYDEVTECRDALQEMVDNAENIDAPVVPKAIDNDDVKAELEEFVNQCDEVIDGEGNVSFPGMY